VNLAREAIGLVNRGIEYPLAAQMSRPVPSPSMKGMMGWSGTCNLPLLMVIFSPPAGIFRVTGMAADMGWLLYCRDQC
jgi:hypothetical protein